MTVIKSNNTFEKKSKGKILLLGGTGYLGNAVANKAVLEGYSVTSLSRRGKTKEDIDNNNNKIDYRTGDARDKAVIDSILNNINDNDNNNINEEEQYVAVIHCIGLLFDGASNLGKFNRLMSGSGSVPDASSTYDDVTRLTAMNAMDATERYATSLNRKSININNNNYRSKRIPFVFTSAAEAGWPDMRGGSFVERTLIPKWMRRYLLAKRSVEERLLSYSNNNNSNSSSSIRPVIFRPSLIYSLDKIRSLPPVGAFFVGNKVGLPFVDRPVTVQSLANAFVKSISDDTVIGVQRFKEIDALNR